MKADNFVQALRAFTRRRPFRPFVLQFVTGETILVSHPEAIRLFGEVALLTGTDNRQRLFDALSVCQLLDPPPATSPQDTNPERPAQE